MKYRVKPSSLGYPSHLPPVSPTTHALSPLTRCSLAQQQFMLLGNDFRLQHLGALRADFCNI